MATKKTTTEQINELRSELASFGRTGDSDAALAMYVAINMSGLPVEASDETGSWTFTNMTELFRMWPAVCFNFGEPHPDWVEIWMVD